MIPNPSLLASTRLEPLWSGTAIVFAVLPATASLWFVIGVLAAYATGASQAYIYVRAEYPRAVERLDRHQVHELVIHHPVHAFVGRAGPQHVLEGFVQASTDFAGDDPRHADRELIALTPHLLDENGHLQLARAVLEGDPHSVIEGMTIAAYAIGAEFGVSMTPAREAVRRLVAEGALTLSSSGRVTTPELQNDRIEELAALRALIETELASRALPRAHMALIERLEAAAESRT